jgi:aspartyl-tRNA(Asn)/glutamyl-tRNA(Gln) amidotransferase subunit A
MDETLADLTGAQMAKAFAARSLSPVEVMRHVIARVERLEPHLCATYAFDPVAALESARASEQRWTDGVAFSPSTAYRRRSRN